MEWKKFKELDREYPEAIIEKKIKGFDNATEGLASLAVVKLTDTRAMNSGVQGDFRFELVLYSNILKQYKFRILTFGYGITLSPIYIKLEDSVNEELYGDDPMNIFVTTRSVENTKELDEIVSKIFETKYFNLVVRGLMKVAKKVE